MSIDGGMTNNISPAEFDQPLADYGAFGGQGYFPSATSFDQIREYRNNAHQQYGNLARFNSLSMGWRI